VTIFAASLETLDLPLLYSDLEQLESTPTAIERRRMHCAKARQCGGRGDALSGRDARPRQEPEPYRAPMIADAPAMPQCKSERKLRLGLASVEFVRFKPFRSFDCPVVAAL
jgi:hypothetical protein